MPLISGTVPSLINGISQQPATLRMPTQGEVQKNGFSHISRGLEKRSCTEHVSEILGVNSTNSNDVFIHTIRRSEDEAYALIVKGGISGGAAPIVKLYDLTGFATGTPGNEVFIHPTKQSGAVTGNSLALDTDVSNYLSNFTASGNDIFAPNKLSVTTVADFSFILNKTQTVKKKTNETHATSNYQAVVYVKTGDFNADYKVKVTVYDNKEMTTPLSTFGTNGVKEVTFKTPDNQTKSGTGDDPTSETLSINNQNAVVVSNIAKALWTGSESTGVVPVQIGFTGSSDKKSQIQKQSDNSAYTGTKGVISEGDVTSSPTTGKGLKDLGDVFNTGSLTGTTNSTTNKITNITTTGLRVGQLITGTGITANSLITEINTKGTNNNGTITVTAVTGNANITDIVVVRGVYTDGESLLYLESTKPFTVECTDGKGDSFMVAINASDEVPNFGSLPASKIPEDFVAKISGDKSSGQDDYYVKWNGSVYKETFRPKYPLDNPQDSRKALDNTTMPMQLFKQFDSNNDIYFVLQPIDFAERTVGDDTTNPFPSFADYDDSVDQNGVYKINDIFFHRNRLGFISDENVILSEAANYFNFFANTVLSVLDTSVVDVAVSNNQVAILKSAIPFQENLLLFSDLQQFKLTSDEFLTPTSVTVNVATNFETSTEAKPVAAGKTIFFPFQRGAFSGIREYMIDVASETNDANEVTSHVPELVAGTVKKMAVSSNEEVLCVLSDTDRSELYIYKYYYSDKEKLQSSWSSWKFDADIIDMEFIGSVAFFLFRRGNKIYLEKLNLSVDNATTIMDDKIGVRLDRRVKLEYSGSGAVPTVPYSDVNHDVVAQSGQSVKASGAGLNATNDASQFGKRIQIKNVGQKPRIGQTFTSAHDKFNTYTVTSVGDLANNVVEIEVTPSIAKTPEENQGGPIPHDTILTFKEREIVYVVETGEVLKANQVSGALQNGSPYSKARGNTTPAIFAGIPYDFEYTFSEQFVKSGDDSINSGRLQMRNFEISYDRSGFFQVEVAPKPFDDRLRKINVRSFTGRKIGSLFLGKQELDTGVFRVPVYVNSKDVKISVLSDSWLPLALQSADYEAYQVLRNQRI